MDCRSRNARSRIARLIRGLDEATKPAARKAHPCTRPRKGTPSLTV